MKRIFSIILILSLVFTTLIPSLTQARSSVMWGENNQRTRNVGTSLANNYSEIPNSPISYDSYLTASHASPTIIETTDGKTIMYVKDSEHEWVYAIDLDNPSTPLWSKTILNTQGQPSTPMYYGKTKEDPNHQGYNGHDVIFVASGDYMYALDAWTGATISQKPIKKDGKLNRTGSHPLVVNDRYLYIGSSNGYFYGWDLSDNMQPIFEKHLGGWVSAAPTQIEDKIVVSTDDTKGKVYVLNQTGTVLHTYTANAGVPTAVLAINSSQFLVTDKKGNIYKGDTNGNFEEINTYLGTGRNKTLQPLALGNDGYAYLAIDYDSNNHGHIYGINVNNGELKHLYEADNRIISAPTVTNDAIFFAEENGAIVAIEKQTGKPFIWYENSSNKVYSSGNRLFSSVTIAGGKHNYITIATDDGINVYAPQQPNLISTNITPTNSTYNTDQNINYKVTFKNDGYSDATSFKVKLYKNSIYESNELGEITISSLAKEQSKTITIPTTFTEPGKYTVIAYVDADNSIEETSETDNTIETQVTIERYIPPDEVFADFNIKPNPVGVNQAFEIEDLAKANNDTIIKREWKLETETDTYQWQTDANNNVTSGIRPSKIDQLGKFPVTYKVTTQNGKIATKTKELEVVNNPPDDIGLPPYADFDIVTPIWSGDDIEVTDKSYDEDGYIRLDAWSYKQEGENDYNNELPSTETPGEYIIKRTVMDNDGNVAYKEKELTILEKIPTIDLIPGNEYAYPTETKTAFPYEVDITDTDYEDWSYKLPNDFPIWEYEIRANDNKIILFKKDDYHLWEVKDREVIDVTPTNFYIENDKKFVIKDVQIVNDNTLVSGYYLYWGHYKDFAADNWNYSDGTLERYTEEAYEKPNLVIDYINYTVDNYRENTGWLRVRIRNYSLVPTQGTIKLGIEQYYDDYPKMVSRGIVSEKEIDISLGAMGKSDVYEFYVESYVSSRYFQPKIDFTKQIDELSETDNYITNIMSSNYRSRFVEFFPARNKFKPFNNYIYENMPWYFYPDYAKNEDGEQLWYSHYNIESTITDSTHNSIVKLNQSYNIAEINNLTESIDTNDIQIRKIDNNRALVVYDYVDPYETIPGGYNKSTIVAGVYDISTNSFKEIYNYENTAHYTMMALYPFSYTGTVAWKQSFVINDKPGASVIFEGPGYIYNGKLLDFKFDGTEGWILADIGQYYYTSTDRDGIVSYSSKYERQSDDYQTAIKIKYNESTDKFTFEHFKQSGSKGEDWPHPYKYFNKIMTANDPYHNDTWRIENLVQNKNGFIAFNNDSDIFDAKESREQGVYDAYYNLSYMVADALGVSPSQIGSIQYIAGISANDYSLLYVKRLTTGTYHLLAYDSMSVKEYTIPGLPEGTIISSFENIIYDEKEYILVNGNNNGQPVMYLFEPTKSLFNVPLYFSINTDYELPIGVHIFNNQFVNQEDILDKLNNNYEVSITKKLTDGTTSIYDSFTLNDANSTEILTSSKGTSYLNFYRPFNSTEDAEYIVELNVNPNKTITEQNFLKQPLYDNNIAYSRFLTINNKKPTLSMSRTKIFKDRSSTEEKSRIDFDIYQHASFNKYEIYMKNIDSNDIYTLKSGTTYPTTKYFIPDLSIYDIGQYKMYIKVYTKYNQVLISDPAPFEIRESTPPIVDIIQPSSVEQNNPTLFNTLKPTIKWSFIDEDEDIQTKAYIYLYKIENSKQTYVRGQYISDDAAEYTYDEDLEDNTLYMVYVKAYDNYDYGYSEYKYFYLNNNRPPTANFTYSPTVIYEGDTITLTDTSTDPDNNITSHQWTIVEPDGNVITKTSKDTTITNTKAGTYTVSKKVTDSALEEATITKSISVYSLTIIGMVNHTSKWDENRIKYNLSETGTEDSPRTYDTFWSGENFILQASTTDIDPLSEVKPLSVSVEILNEGYNTSLTLQPDSYTWKGELWDETMVNKWGTYSIKTLTFRFKATYSNGTIKTKDIGVYIDNIEGYWRQHGIW